MSELLEWRDHDTTTETTFTGFGQYMVERLDEDNYRIWLPDDTKSTRIMVGGFSSRKDARAACQSNLDLRRSTSRAISGDAGALETALNLEELSVEYWWARAKDAEAALQRARREPTTEEIHDLIVKFGTFGSEIWAHHRNADECDGEILNLFRAASK